MDMELKNELKLLNNFWIKSIPNKYNLIGDDAFGYALHMVYQSNISVRCDLCGKYDNMILHPQRCGKPNYKLRHNWLELEWSKLFTRCGIRNSIEYYGLMNSRLSPGDIYVPSINEGQSWVIDLGIINPTNIMNQKEEVKDMKIKKDKNMQFWIHGIHFYQQ